MSNELPAALARLIDDAMALAIGRDAIATAVASHWLGEGLLLPCEIARKTSRVLDAQRPTSVMGLVWRLAKTWEALVDDLGGWEQAKGSSSMIELELAMLDAQALVRKALEGAIFREGNVTS